MARATPVEQRGYALLRRRQYAAAAHSFRAALRVYRGAVSDGPRPAILAAHIANALRSLGIAYERSGNVALARRTWVEMADAVPSGWEPRAAERLVLSKDYRGAFRAYDRFLFQGSATAVSPIFADAGAVRPFRDALTAGENGKYADARRLALDALEHAPNFGYARLVLGMVDAASADRPGAAREWIAAIEAQVPPTTGPEQFDAATISAARLLNAI